MRREGQTANSRDSAKALGDSEGDVYHEACHETGDVKQVQGEGMPYYRNPFEKGRLLIQFNVVFPPNLEPSMAEALAKILPPAEEPMIPDDHDEVDMNDYDPDTDRQQNHRRGHQGYDDDDEGHGHHGPGVQCASQ